MIWGPSVVTPASTCTSVWQWEMSISCSIATSMHKAWQQISIPYFQPVRDSAGNITYKWKVPSSILCIGSFSLVRNKPICWKCLPQMCASWALIMYLWLTASFISSRPLNGVEFSQAVIFQFRATTQHDDIMEYSHSLVYFWKWGQRSANYPSNFPTSLSYLFFLRSKIFPQLNFCFRAIRSINSTNPTRSGTNRWRHNELLSYQQQPRANSRHFLCL